jgi:hypothetical protein
VSELKKTSGKELQKTKVVKKLTIRNSKTHRTLETSVINAQKSRNMVARKSNLSAKLLSPMISMPSYENLKSPLGNFDPKYTSRKVSFHGDSSPDFEQSKKTYYDNKISKMSPFSNKIPLNLEFITEAQPAKK